MTERPIVLLPAEPVAVMTSKPSSAMLRRWSMQCAVQADSAALCSEARQRFLNMRTSLLDLADAQDWLDGRDVTAGMAVQCGPNVPINRTMH